MFITSAMIEIEIEIEIDRTIKCTGSWIKYFVLKLLQSANNFKVKLKCARIDLEWNDGDKISLAFITK